MAANTSELTIAAGADMHVHLRSGAMCELVTPHVAAGGVDVAYVMPNLVPPITTTAMCLAYLDTLSALAPQTTFIGTLYLSPSLTVDELRAAKASGRIGGVKSYPRGVTTNSAAGIEDYSLYHPIFAEMQRLDLTLNLHGEVPSAADICVMNAEHAFLTHLHQLHTTFPRLRIVLEHATTAAAVHAVKACGPTVACSITPHHLALIVDDWAGKPLNFCKPVAKLPSDRDALRAVIKEGHPRFFLGSDSAPHPLTAKLPSPVTHESVVSCACAAGIYTSPILLPLCATLLESFGALHQLENYVSNNGRSFYGLPPASPTAKVTLRRTDNFVIPDTYVHPTFAQLANSDPNKDQLSPFWAGKKLNWEIVAP